MKTINTAEELEQLLTVVAALMTVEERKAAELLSNEIAAKLEAATDNISMIAFAAVQIYVAKKQDRNQKGLAE